MLILRRVCLEVKLGCKNQMLMKCFPTLRKFCFDCIKVDELKQGRHDVSLDNSQ